MNDTDRALVRELLTQRRVLALALLVNGKPHVGLLPFVLKPDFTGLLIHASRMARHSQGLLPGAPFSALIHSADTPDADPLQIPRLTLEGEVHVFERDSPAYSAARTVYLKRLPQSDITFELADFSLYELRLRSARLVAGFARAANVPLDVLHELGR
jgi:putative heme iron utilization protein